MLKSYFTIAFRNLLRHKLFSAINVFCLAIGITFSLIMGVYVLNQYQVNQSLKNINNQYLIKSNWKVKEMGLDITTFGPLARTLKDEYPSLVANYYRYDPVTNVVSAGDKFFKEDIAIGDTSLVSMYGFPVLYGDKDRAFTDNNSAVITETMAMKLFGEKNVLGKTIGILGTSNNEKQLYKVSAVLKDLPYNSVTHLIGATYTVFVPAEGNHYFQGGDPMQFWNSAYIIGAIELQPGKSPND
ncbi:MAG: ABC transporter permease, partial [Flavisolibacter sp.]